MHAMRDHGNGPHRRGRWLLGLILWLSGACASGQDLRLFDVELIIFEHVGTAEQSREVWAESPHPTPLEPSISLAALSDPEEPRPAIAEAALFEELPADAFNLSAEAAALTRSARYRVLLHTAWRQPGLAPEQAIALNVLYPLDPEAAASAEATAASAPAPLSVEGLAATSSTTQDPGPLADVAPPPPLHRLEGVVRLHLQRYLHLAVDLVYFSGEMITPESQFLSDVLTVDAIPEAFHLVESRRLRSGELHYFDHPVIGIVALVTPYDPPLKPATTDKPAPAAKVTP